MSIIGKGNDQWGCGYLEIMLAPCPFCGGSARVVYNQMGWEENNTLAVCCQGYEEDGTCQVTPHTAWFEAGKNGLEKAIRTWNTRYISQGNIGPVRFFPKDEEEPEEKENNENEESGV